MALWLKKRGHRPLATHLQTPFAELDLVFAHGCKRELFLIEVKSRAAELSPLELVSHRQRLRLKRAHLWMSEQNPRYLVRSCLALVEPDQRLSWIIDFLEQ